MARWDQGYSFRSSDFNGERPRRQQAPVAPAEGLRPCARGDWCATRTITVTPAGSEVHPALGPRAFCEADRGNIESALHSMPGAYLRVAAEISQMSRGGQLIRSPFGPRLPLRGDIDALMRLIAEVLLSWEERVREVARLSVMDTQLSRQRNTARAVDAAVTLLGAHLDVLIGLEPGPMFRAERDGVVLADLDGGDAGNEILRLHYRARSVLGEVVRQAETLDGVPCKMCDAGMSLERAEPPSDPRQEAMYSRCSVCRQGMTLKEYRDWSKWYAGWAQRAGLTCRRCQTGRCGECAWRACSCGHAAA